MVQRAALVADDRYKCFSIRVVLHRVATDRTRKAELVCLQDILGGNADEWALLCVHRSLLKRMAVVMTTIGEAERPLHA